MTNFTRAKVTLKEHYKQSSHRSASMAVVDFLNHMEKGAISVAQQIQSQGSALVQQNQRKILSILKTIVFCDKQNISLGGHREQPLSALDVHIEQSNNHGNFRALLNFQVEAGDSVLGDHFQSSQLSSKYISPQIQNDLVIYTGDWIREQIINEVKNAKLFSICADEASDISNKEQLPLIFRFVDESNTIRESSLILFYVTLVQQVCCNSREDSNEDHYLQLL